jgi:hypothetical protein
VWPDPRVVALVNDAFLPIQLHVKDHAADFKRFGERYGATWTPATLVLDPEGTERHRIEGFVPADEFMAQLSLGLGHLAFQAKEYDKAETRFRDVVRTSPSTEAAPEAQYWAGVSRYKSSHDASALAETARDIDRNYADTIWAKKASVWKH